MDEDNQSTTDMRERVRALTAAIDAAKQYRNPVSFRGRPYHRMPYPAPSYRGARGSGQGTYYGAPSPQYRNRTLHLRSQSQPVSLDETPDRDSTKTTSESWVSKRDRHLQLINKSVYDKRLDEQSTGSPGISNAQNPSMMSHIRSSKGAVSSPGTIAATKSAILAAKPPAKTELCRNFCSTGQCRKGSKCPFIHDPAKVAICKEYLAKGTCHKDPYCDLSHDSNPHRVPPCIHFLRGNCTNANCRYPHYQTNPQAPICVHLVTLGYCEKAVDCADRHEIECPEYASKGSCSNPKCRLPHIDHAGQMGRTTAKQTTKLPSPAEGGSLLDNLEAVLSDQETRGKQTAQADPDITESHAHHGMNPTFSQGDNFMSLEVDPDGLFEKQFGS